jgi:hypothetical protein
MAFVLFMKKGSHGMGMKHVCNICAHKPYMVSELQCCANKYGSCLQIAHIDKQSGSPMWNKSEPERERAMTGGKIIDS